MNELIITLMKNNCKIMVYPVSEKSWIDVGQWNEYKKAVEKLMKILLQFVREEALKVIIK